MDKNLTPDVEATLAILTSNQPHYGEPMRLGSEAECPFGRVYEPDSKAIMHAFRPAVTNQYLAMDERAGTRYLLALRMLLKTHIDETRDTMNGLTEQLGFWQWVERKVEWVEEDGLNIDLGVELGRIFFLTWSKATDLDIAIFKYFMSAQYGEILDDAYTFLDTFTALMQPPPPSQPDTLPGQPVAPECADPRKPFTWLKTDGQLEALYTGLTKAGMLECSMEAWKGMFGRGGCVEAVKWLDSDALLAYLLDKLEPYVKRLDYDSRFAMAAVFMEGRNGKLDNKLMGNTSQSYRNNKQGKPKNGQAIDGIMQQIDGMGLAGLQRENNVKTMKVL